VSGSPARIGYGRVSTRDQNPNDQRDALVAAGCDPGRLFIDKATTAAGRLTFHIIGALDEFAPRADRGEHPRGPGRRAGPRPRRRPPPKLSPDQVQLARQLYNEKGPDGRRARTVAQIATMLSVSRTTIYRHPEAAAGEPTVR
jgi:DNA invertase Pin-like site-specific DNA recombinase